MIAATPADIGASMTTTATTASAASPRAAGVSSYLLSQVGPAARHVELAGPSGAARHVHRDGA